MPRFHLPFQPLQIGPHIRSVLVAHVPILLQRLVDDLFQLGRKVGIQPHCGNWVAFENRVEDDRGTIAPEGQCAGCHLVQHSAERKQIAARIQFFRARLLRRHVGDGAERRTRAGEVLVVNRAGHGVGCRGVGCCNFARRAGCGSDLRQAEIQYLGVPALGHEDVRRLDVAVDDAGSVSGVERVGDVDGDGEKNVRFQRTPGDAVLQRQPVQKFHGDERFAVLLVNFVDGADVGMVQSGGGLRFALEARQRLGIFSNLVGQELEGDKAMQL